MNDDDYGLRLMRQLPAEPPGVPRIDVTAAMRQGRRARRTPAMVDRLGIVRRDRGRHHR